MADWTDIMANSYAGYGQPVQSGPTPEELKRRQQMFNQGWANFTAPVTTRHPLDNSQAPLPVPSKQPIDNWNGQMAQNTPRPSINSLMQFIEGSGDKMDRNLASTGLNQLQQKDQVMKDALLAKTGKAMAPSQAAVYDPEKNYADSMAGMFKKSMDKRQQSLDYANQLREAYANNLGTEQLDLSPLMALTDDITGGNLSKGYAKPTDTRARAGQIEAMRRSAANEERGISQDMMGLLKVKAQQSAYNEAARSKREERDWRQMDKFALIRHGAGRGGALLREFHKRGLAINMIEGQLDGILSGKIAGDSPAMKELSAQISMAKSGSAPQLSIIDSTDYQNAHRAFQDGMNWITSGQGQAMPDDILNNMRESISILKGGVKDYHNSLYATFYNSQIHSNKYDKKYPDKLQSMAPEFQEYIELDEDGKAWPKGYFATAKANGWPEIGHVDDGKKYIGGNPSNKLAWEKM